MSMTFDDLSKLEPRLEPLLQEAKTQHTTLPTYRKRVRYWYKVLKPKMFGLVGMGSKHPDQRLHTSAAYDTAYSELYGAVTGEYLVTK